MGDFHITNLAHCDAVRGGGIHPIICWRQATLFGNDHGHDVLAPGLQVVEALADRLHWHGGFGSECLAHHAQDARIEPVRLGQETRRTGKLACPQGVHANIRDADLIETSPEVVIVATCRLEDNRHIAKTCRPFGKG